MKSKIRSNALSGTAPIQGEWGRAGKDCSHGDERPHLNEQQLAKRWGISVKKLQADRLKGGGIPFVRIGRAVRYRFVDIVAWEERNLHTSTTVFATSSDQVK